MVNIYNTTHGPSSLWAIHSFSSSVKQVCQLQYVFLPMSEEQEHQCEASSVKGMKFGFTHTATMVPMKSNNFL